MTMNQLQRLQRTVCSYQKVRSSYFSSRGSCSLVVGLLWLAEFVSRSSLVSLLLFFFLARVRNLWSKMSKIHKHRPMPDDSCDLLTVIPNIRLPDGSIFEVRVSAFDDFTVLLHFSNALPQCTVGLLLCFSIVLLHCCT